VKTYPPVPRVEEAPEELFESGHLWVQELIDGAQLRFRLRESGVVEFADNRRSFGEEPPLVFRHAVRHVRETLDREALRSASRSSVSRTWRTACRKTRGGSSPKDRRLSANSTTPDSRSRNRSCAPSISSWTQR